MPGSDIPDWLTQGTVSYSRRKNLELISVFVGVVVSVNHQTIDDLTRANLKDELFAIRDLKVKILRQNQIPFDTSVPIPGVPKMHEDQFYLSRYPDYSGLVLMLKDGDQIQVAMRDPPYTKGVELKKWGIHFIFENDDDYEGDETSLDESQQSVSEKLTRFIGGLRDENFVRDANRDLEGKILERELRKDCFYRLNAFTLLSSLCVLGLALVIYCLKF